MKPGDVLETAIWMTGRETPDQVRDGERQISLAFEQACARNGVEIGAVTFEEKYPNEDRVPAVPDHVSGPDVRLLVATAEVVALAPAPRGFVGDLDRDDLERLREMTRRAHAKARPGETLTDIECDDVIEEIGPDAAMAAVREAVNGGLH